MNRAELIDELAASVRDERVLTAIAAVSRQAFVAPELRDRAWENVALPIGRGQTISQPYVVARMLELLAVSAGDRVLDVGTGSGYHAALLARLCAEVVTIERDPELSATAAARLRALGIANVTCLVGDGGAGGDGVIDAEPFDAINVAAAAPAVPPTLLARLADGGRLVAPVGADTPAGAPGEQHLVRVTRTGARLRHETFEPVRFVPLVRSPIDR